MTWDDFGEIAWHMTGRRVRAVYRVTQCAAAARGRGLLSKVWCDVDKEFFADQTSFRRKAVPRVWNNLPSHLRQDINCRQFK